MAKTQQLQIRVTPSEKALLQARAAQAGMDLSKWMLHQALPPAEERFQALCGALAHNPHQRSHLLAELNDLLTRLSADELAKAVEHTPIAELPEFETAYVASMVEQATAVRSIRHPAWTNRVKALARPWFASNLESLRLHLLTRSPPPFRHRNLFIDSTIGDRV